MTTKPRNAETRPKAVKVPPKGRPSDRQAPTPAAPKAATEASAWKKQGELLTLPSGNVLRVSNPGIMDLASQGLIPNNLMTMMMESVQKGKEPNVEDILGEDLDIEAMINMVNNAVISIAVEPEIHPVPVWQFEDVEAELCTETQVGKPALSKQDPNLVYIKDVSEEDKMFIFQWATGGTTDVEQFRQESSNLLGSVPGLTSVGSTSKRTTSNKR